MNLFAKNGSQKKAEIKKALIKVIVIKNLKIIFIKFIYSSCLVPASFSKSMLALLIQYLCPVGIGPSLKTWPR